MILWIVFILAGIVAYYSMSAGIYTVISRTLMGILAVAAGIGFAGPVRQQIPFENEILYSACLLVITALVYLIQRGLANYYISDRIVNLPEFIDRIGSAVTGFVGAVIAFSFISLILATLPWPTSFEKTTHEFRHASCVAIDMTRIVGVFAGTGKPIVNRQIQLQKPTPSPDDLEPRPPEQTPTPRPTLSPQENKIGTQGYPPPLPRDN
ncbi:MAG: hypothetical protein ACYTF1_18580 [Planctomycetota bacterium]|jgi:uncharacterized membrane protein required for colicin V production